MSIPAWLEEVLTTRARWAVFGAGLLLVAALFFPLWEITMFAQMFPEGIRMSIYAHKLVGGNAGADLQGINILNHYIGMREIRAADFPEMKFIPFALGFFVLLGLRAALFGRVHQVVDLLVLFSYFGLFSLMAFYTRMHAFGHQLNPEAPIKVAPFTPPVFGHQHIANFDGLQLSRAGHLPARSVRPRDRRGPRTRGSARTPAGHGGHAGSGRRVIAIMALLLAGAAGYPAAWAGGPPGSAGHSRGRPWCWARPGQCCAGAGRAAC